MCPSSSSGPQAARLRCLDLWINRCMKSEHDVDFCSSCTTRSCFDLWNLKHCSTLDVIKSGCRYPDSQTSGTDKHHDPKKRLLSSPPSPRHHCYISFYSGDTLMDVTVSSLLTIILKTSFHVHIIAMTDRNRYTDLHLINHAGT